MAHFTPRFGPHSLSYFFPFNSTERTLCSWFGCQPYFIHFATWLDHNSALLHESEISRRSRNSTPCHDASQDFCRTWVPCLVRPVYLHACRLLDMDTTMWGLVYQHSASSRLFGYDSDRPTQTHSGESNLNHHRTDISPPDAYKYIGRSPHNSIPSMVQARCKSRHTPETKENGGRSTAVVGLLVYQHGSIGNRPGLFSGTHRRGSHCHRANSLAGA
jgi:hypothetical protein